MSDNNNPIMPVKDSSIDMGTVTEELKVSKPATETITEEPTVTTKKIEDQDDGDSTTTSEDEGEVSKELGMVISALQDTVKQNKEEKEIAEERMISQEQDHEGEEELHSCGDNDSETKSMTDDNTSVATSASTSVSHEEEKQLEEKDITASTTTTTTSTVTEDESNTIPQTFEEIVQGVLPPTPGVAPQRQTFDLGGRSSEDVGDVESYSANLIALNKIDTKEIKANLLSPRQQERAGKYYILSFYIMYTHTI